MLRMTHSNVTCFFRGLWGISLINEEDARGMLDNTLKDFIFFQGFFSFKVFFCF